MLNIAELELRLGDESGKRDSYLRAYNQAKYVVEQLAPELQSDAEDISSLKEVWYGKLLLYFFEGSAKKVGQTVAFEFSPEVCDPASTM